MENSSSTIWIIGIILGLVIFFNFAAIFMAKNNQEKLNKRFDNYGKVLNGIRNPYKKEEKDFEKLASLVNKIREENEDEK